MKIINVLVVDDSAFMRKLITEFLSDHKGIKVIGSARNGRDAIEKIKELKPDVVTMDIEMPVMDGLEALKIIMKECPAAVIVLSSTSAEGAAGTMQAMEAGAFDFIPKPSGSISLDLHKIKHSLLDTVMEAGKANIKKLQTPGGRLQAPAMLQREVPAPHRAECRNASAPAGKLVLIGTSTGGPRALQTVISALPADLDAPVLIVQHMPAGFTKSLAGRLDSISALSVKEAEDGEQVQKGTAYIAPGGWHLKVKEIGSSLVLNIDKSETRNGHRPSVDTLFESASALADYQKIAVIMTGMGSDGTKGLIKLKETPSTVSIAESEHTSIVFGMPRAAIAAGCVDKVLDLENIAGSIAGYVN